MMMGSFCSLHNMVRESDEGIITDSYPEFVVISLEGSRREACESNVQELVRRARG